MSNAPELPAYRSPDKIHWIVWCDDCRCYHFHGLATDGHRVAHCFDTSKRPRDASRYARTGYVLVDAGLAPEEIVRDSKRKYSRGPSVYPDSLSPRKNPLPNAPTRILPAA